MNNSDNFVPLTPLLIVQNHEWLNALSFKDKHFHKCGNAGAYNYTVVESSISTTIKITCAACGETVTIVGGEWEC